ncbi:MAG: 2-(1,2-epoxy-1,2-dihydrophenyl)acetyl-CoA isomerase [Gammaproteobacteria bacterium]|nr:2-(1,2-epoxy-1,2-dihydrophenyl)acetyl-CoA isomerase [Gammaproteobacteria bacterium]
MSTPAELLESVENGVMTLTLNRPDRLNALTETLHHALQASFKRAYDDTQIRAVLLTGAGRGFCAGQDLGQRDPRAGEINLGETIGNFYNPLMRLIRGLPKPVVCAVNGVAAGAGANLALGCDMVIAARSAKFIQAFAKLGLVPDCGGTWILPRLIGEARAKALALTAEPLSAEQAENWGAIYQVVDDDALMQTAIELAERLAKGPTMGLGKTKLALQQSTYNTFDAQLDLERDWQQSCGRSNDYAEGVTAFLEKRTPTYQGN